MNNKCVGKGLTQPPPKIPFQNSAQERLGINASVNVMLFLLLTYVSHTWSANEKQSVRQVVYCHTHNYILCLIQVKFE